MRNFLLPYLILLLPQMTLSQQDPGIQKQIDELRLRVKALEKENQQLISEGRSYDSAAYCLVRLEIFEAFTNIPKLDFDFKSTTEKIAVTGLFAKLIQANNPASDILGFRFTDLVIAAADKHFKNALKNESDKKRLSQVILKIIDNPFVSALANTNPVTSVVSTIISTIVGFTTASVNMEKDGGRIRNVTVEQEDAFCSKSITGFRQELQIYITFYDQLIIATDKYLSGLENLNSKYAYLMSSVNSYKDDLYEVADPEKSNQLISLTLLLPEPDRLEIDHNLLLQDPRIRNCLLIARKYPVLQQSVSDFKREYNQLLFKFLEDYIVTLETARLFPDHAIDKSRTDELIRDIRLFIKNQQTPENNQPDAFSP